MQEIAKFRNITKKYGESVIVDHLNLSIYSGEILGLLGPNGSGKSTTLNMLCGGIKADDGEISLFHQTEVWDKKIRSQIGLVPQDLAIYLELTVEDNISFFGSLYGFTRKELQEHVEYMLKWGNLGPYRNELVRDLAVEVQRQINLVCGLVHDPKLLILDEPTIGIDLRSRQYILKQLRQWVKPDRAIVYTSHYMEEVEALCDRIAILLRGKLIAVGTMAQLHEMVAQPGETLSLYTIYLRLTGTRLKKEGEDA